MMSGIRSDQNATRNAMKSEKFAPHDTIKFHAMLDWNRIKKLNYSKNIIFPEIHLKSVVM